MHSIVNFKGEVERPVCRRCGYALAKAGLTYDRYSHYQRLRCPLCKRVTRICLWKSPEVREPITKAEWQRSRRTNVIAETFDKRLHYGAINVGFTNEEIERLSLILEEKGREPRYSRIENEKEAQ